MGGREDIRLPVAELTVKPDKKSFFENIEECRDCVLDAIKSDKRILIATHLDADGLAAASILGKILLIFGAPFVIRVYKQFDEDTLKDLNSDSADICILTDMGSGYLHLIEDKLNDSKCLIILDHHKPVLTEVSSKNVLHTNPHIYGIDGTYEISGAGVTYFLAKAIEPREIELAHLAVVGALGDMQDRGEKRSLCGLNEEIVKDSVNAGVLEVTTDILFFGRETKPIYKAIATSYNPYLPGLTGREDAVSAFLSRIGISLKEGERWKTFSDLSFDEKQKIFSELTLYMVQQGISSKDVLSLIGTVYTLKNEEKWSPLRDCREFAHFLNACGKLNEGSLGIAICLGERRELFDRGLKLLEDYRREIGKILSWIERDPVSIRELEYIYIVNGENVLKDTMASTTASVLLSSGLVKQDKPVVVFAELNDKHLKVSLRAGSLLVEEKGLNLAEIVQKCSEKVEGLGGGHSTAAGALIPKERKERFIELLQEEIRRTR